MREAKISEFMADITDSEKLRALRKRCAALYARLSELRISCSNIPFLSRLFAAFPPDYGGDIEHRPREQHSEERARKVDPHVGELRRAPFGEELQSLVQKRHRRREECGNKKRLPLHRIRAICKKEHRSEQGIFGKMCGFADKVTADDDAAAGERTSKKF